MSNLPSVHHQQLNASHILEDFFFLSDISIPSAWNKKNRQSEP